MRAGRNFRSIVVFAGFKLRRLERQLRGGDPRARLLAVQALGELGDARAVRPLLGAFHTHGGELGTAIREALVRLRSARPVQPLMDALRWGGHLTKCLATEELGELGDARAVPALMNLKPHDHDLVHCAAARAVARLGDFSAVQRLLAASQDKQRWEVWNIAAEAMARLGGAGAVEPLLAALQSNRVKVESLSANAICDLGDVRLMELLLARSEERSDWATWNAVVAAMAKLGGARAVAPLQAALQAKQAQVRPVGAKAICDLGDDRLMELLLARSEVRSDGDTWNVVVAALVARGDARAMDLLQAALRTERLPEAAEALCKLGDFHAVDVLLAGDEYWDAASGQPSQIVRDAFVKMRGTGAVDSVRASVAANRYDRRRTARALILMGEPQGVELLLADCATSAYGLPWHLAVVELCQAHDLPVLEPLLSALNSSDKHVRLAAVAVLGNLKDPRSVPPLLATLEKENEWRVRRGVAWTLARVADRELVRQMLATALAKDNRDVWSVLAVALGIDGDASAVEPLLKVSKADLDGLARRAPYPAFLELERRPVAATPPGVEFARVLAKFRELEKRYHKEARLLPDILGFSSWADTVYSALARIGGELAGRDDKRGEAPLLAVLAYRGADCGVIRSLAALGSVCDLTPLVDSGDVDFLCSFLDKHGHSAPVQHLQQLAYAPNYRYMVWEDHEPILVNNMEPGSRTETITSSMTEKVTSLEPVRQRARAELARRGLG